jgi:hypothetical protein
MTQSSLHVWIIFFAIHIQGANSWTGIIPLESRNLVKHPTKKNGFGKSNVFLPKVDTTHIHSVAVPYPEDSSSLSMTKESLASSLADTPESEAKSLAVVKELSEKERIWQKARKEGGLFTFNTKYGALNPYAIYYGFVSIFLGLFWYAALMGIQCLYFVTGGRLDKKVRS